LIFGGNISYWSKNSANEKPLISTNSEAKSTIGHKTLMSLFDFWREHLSLALNSANEKPLILTISEAMSTIGHKTSAFNLANQIHIFA